MRQRRQQRQKQQRQRQRQRQRQQQQSYRCASSKARAGVWGLACNAMKRLHCMAQAAGPVAARTLSSKSKQCLQHAIVYTMQLVQGRRRGSRPVQAGDALSFTMQTRGVVGALVEVQRVNNSCSCESNCSRLRVAAGVEAGAAQRHAFGMACGGNACLHRGLVKVSSAYTHKSQDDA